MSSTTVCRVCLAGGTGELVLQSVNSLLVEVYEKLTNVKISSDVMLCYICQAQLQRCYRFTKMANRSEHYLKTLMENYIQVKNETVTNMLNIVKLQTLSVIKLKPIYLDGLQRKRPKKSDKQKDRINDESTKDIDSIKNFENKTNIELVKSEKISFDIDKFENYKIEKEAKDEFVATKNEDCNVNCCSIKKEDSNVLNSETNKANTKEVITEKGNIKEVEINMNELNYQSNSEDIHEDVTQVTDYVVINDTELLYECDICHGTYTTREKLATHQSMHRTEKKTKYSMDEIIKNLPKTKQPYCPICKKFFAGYSSQLIEHLKIHTGERPFVCDTCGKSSRTKHHLLEHIRTHTKERIFCKLCDKSFAQMSSLGKHLLTHTGDSPHFCHLCGKKFTQSGQLRLHIRSVHEGIKPHSCEVCGKSFYSKSMCKKHVGSHTGKKLFSCEKCGTQLATNVSLNRHIKNHCKMAK